LAKIHIVFKGCLGAAMGTNPGSFGFDYFLNYSSSEPLMIEFCLMIPSPGNSVSPENVEQLLPEVRRRQDLDRGDDSELGRLQRVVHLHQFLKTPF
jgi:hypothetical protein